MSFDYRTHFYELLTEIGKSLDALVKNYDGLTIEFTTTGSEDNKTVVNNCVIDSNIKPKERE